MIIVTKINAGISHRIKINVTTYSQLHMALVRHGKPNISSIIHKRDSLGIDKQHEMSELQGSIITTQL